jgi:hypothetical protein
MHWSDLDFDPPERKLRQFAGLWLVFFAGLACWQGFGMHRAAVAIGLALAAVTLGPLGLLNPRLIRPVYIAWMVLAFPIGWLVSRLVLALLFFAVFTPVALAFGLLGRDALTRSLRPDRASYWDPKPAPAGPSSYFRQF